jgi:hypothetical protein
MRYFTIWYGMVPLISKFDLRVSKFRPAARPMRVIADGLQNFNSWVADHMLLSHQVWSWSDNSYSKIRFFLTPYFDHRMTLTFDLKRWHPWPDRHRWTTIQEMLCRCKSCWVRKLLKSNDYLRKKNISSNISLIISKLRIIWLVWLYGKLTNWFNCKTGVKQEDNLSPALFSIFLNDLVQDIYDLNLGVKLVDRKLFISLYADDIALVARSPDDFQRMLHELHRWCRRWRVLINANKSNCIHFRKTRSRVTNFEFTNGLNKLEIVDDYMYLGI